MITTEERKWLVTPGAVLLLILLFGKSNQVHFRILTKLYVNDKCDCCKTSISMMVGQTAKWQNLRKSKLKMRMEGSPLAGLVSSAVVAGSSTSGPIVDADLNCE